LQELPANIGLIVDLTAEFPAQQKVLAGKTYICLPTLDGMVPGDRPFRELLKQLVLWQGNMYIHCALGHGGHSCRCPAGCQEAGQKCDPSRSGDRASTKIGLNQVQRPWLERVTNNLDISYNYDSI